MPLTTARKSLLARPEKLAVNVYDLEGIDAAIRQRVLGPQLDKLDAKNPVWIDRNRDDESAVIFTCDLLTAALACDILRSECRRENGPVIRLYLKKGAWQKVPSTAILTAIINDKAVLNPAVFGGAATFAGKPLEVTPVEF